MSFKRLGFNRFLPVLILLLAVVTRFIGLSWGSGYFFHPDENNMASAVSGLTFDSLDPHFYAYGQFPLYLSFFSYQLFSLITRGQWSVPLTFELSALTLRFWSASFSVASVYLIYLIAGKLFFSKFKAYVTALVAVFTPALIQFAHFGTTESLLIFVFLSNVYLSYLFLDRPRPRYLTIAALSTGLGLASKITALFFVVPLLVTLVILIRQRTLALPRAFVSAFYYLFFSLFTGLVLSPFNLLNFSDFLSSMNYETAVATGSLMVFYTNQFIDTLPYLFQFQRVFPYAVGLPVFILALIGAVLLTRSRSHLSQRQFFYWLILLTVSLVYFVYNGQLFTKWTRFMAPVFPLFIFLSSYFITRLRSPVVYFLVAISFLPGILYLRLYLNPDIRLTATRWINSQIPESSTILSESGNVFAVPLYGNYRVNNFDFYHLDSEPDLPKLLVDQILSADYILVPSRRIFKNQTGSRFPVSQKYYDALFSGRLGFEPVISFSIDTSLLLNPENAEETWTVFDHPTLRLFKKVNYLSPHDIRRLLI